MEELLHDLQRIAEEQETRKDQDILELAASVLSDLHDGRDIYKQSTKRAINKVGLFYNPSYTIEQ